MYQALYRKWRPRTFDDVVGQSHITDTLRRQVREGRLSHAYLFTGTRGTGKTSCAKILARAVNCEHPVDGNPCNTCASCAGIENGSIMDVLELDAASNNGVDQVRALRDEAVYSPAAVRKRVYIVDEVHMLSTPAFNALLKILEEPPQHLMFILATTELHKVPATIKSRCQQFAFKRLSPTDITGRLKFVAEQENIPLAPEGAALLARLADGGMRDALSLLDQCATGATMEALGEKEILASLGLAGNVETAALMGEIASRDAGAALVRLNRLYAAGKDVASLLNELSALTRDLLIRKTAPRGGAALLNGGYDDGTLRRLSEALTTPRLAQLLGQLQAATADLGRSANRRIDAELCLIRLCDETLDDSAAGLNARLARVEEIVASGGGFHPAETPVKESADPARPSRGPAPADSEPGDLKSVGAGPPPKDSEDGPPPFDADPPQFINGDHLSPHSAIPPILPQVTEPVKTPPPQPAAQAQPSTASVGDFWPGLVARLKDRIPKGQYSFLSNPATVKGTIDPPLLTLWVKDDFTKSILSKPGILPAIEQAAALLPGAPYRAVITVGQAPARPAAAPPPQAATAPAEEHDKLDDLLALSEQFGDIITEE